MVCVQNDEAFANLGEEVIRFLFKDEEGAEF